MASTPVSRNRRYTATSPDEVCDPQKGMLFLDKVKFCKALLYIHGFISDAENIKVEKRIEGWIKEHTKENK